jgi:hypothetical protein
MYIYIYIYVNTTIYGWESLKEGREKGQWKLG